MKLTDRTVADLLTAFRSPDPTPGGGSASALAGAVGASLLAMVAQLPAPEAASDEDVLSLRTSGRRCVELAGHLTALIDRDSEAYERVVGAYRLPKSTEQEKAARSGQIQRAMRAAIDAPLDVMRACCEALGHAHVVAEFGNANASSDVEVGRELLRAGLRGARLNVEINMARVKDVPYVEGVREEVERLVHEAGA